MFVSLRMCVYVSGLLVLEKYGYKLYKCLLHTYFLAVLFRNQSNNSTLLMICFWSNNPAPQLSESGNLAEMFRHWVPLDMFRRSLLCNSLFSEMKRYKLELLFFFLNLGGKVWGGDFFPAMKQKTLKSSIFMRYQGGICFCNDAEDLEKSYFYYFCARLRWVVFYCEHQIFHQKSLCLFVFWIVWLCLFFNWLITFLCIFNWLCLYFNCLIIFVFLIEWLYLFAFMFNWMIVFVF